MFNLEKALQRLYNLSSEEIGDIVIQATIESDITLLEDGAPNVWVPLRQKEDTPVIEGD